MGILQKAGNFLGINKFAQGLSTAYRNISGELDKDIANQNKNIENTTKILYLAKQEKDPIKRKKLLDLANTSPTTNLNQIDPGLNISTKEFLGSAGNVALNTALPGAFRGSKLAIVGKNALLGSAFGATSGLEQNRSAKGVVGSTIGGALLGGAIGGTGLVVNKIKKVLTNETPVWLMDKAIKPALNDLKKNVKYGTDTLSRQLLNDGVKGGKNKLLEIANTQLEQNENKLQGILNDKKYAKSFIERDGILKYLSGVIKQKKAVPGMKSEISKIEGIVKSMPEKMSLPEANQIKRSIYQELRDPAYKIDAKLSTKAATLKGIASGLKTEIEKKVSGTTIRDINQKLSIYGRLEDTITDQIARSMRNNGLSLTDAILASGGLTAGLLGSAATGDNKVTPLSFVTTLGLILARHNTTALGTYGAQALRKTGMALENKAVQTAKNQILRRGAFNLK